jgi:hypothetical protein
MDLSALLAQQGIQADDADTLVAWARQRAAALVTRIEPGSALAQQLGVALEQARGGEPAPVAADVPVPMPRSPSRGISRPQNRSVSSPHLGAAVQAALSRNEPAREKVVETAEPEISVEAPAPAPEPEPAPVVADDEDASIGGFNRFAFSLRRRAIEAQPSPVEEPPARAREPEPAAEPSSESDVAWQAIDLELPAPPGFETRPAQDAPTRRADAREPSDSLVVGIPDDDSIDIPLPRPRPRSESRKTGAASPLEAQAAVSQASISSEALELDGLDIDIPEPPVRETTRPQPMGRPNSNVFRAAPPPPPRSGPHRAASGPQAAASQSEPISSPQAASAPALSPPPQKYPTPQSSARRGKTTTAEQKQVARAEPKAAANKKGNKGRKKVVDLSVPVTTPVVAAAPASGRKASIGNHLPTGEPSSAGHQVPAYLQDDDE